MPRAPEPFVDIHCHLLPAIDDGAADWDESLQMARVAVEDGIGTIVCTPHQLGNFAHNDGPAIRQRVVELQRRLNEHRIPLTVVPGADVRIEPDLVGRIRRGEVVSLADTRRYVLLELPHEMYVPLDRLLSELAAAGCRGILSHPERNEGILNDLEILVPLVAAGCLLQITAGSLLGEFGSRCQRFSEVLLQRNLVHFVSTDAHGLKRRRPVLSTAYERVVGLVGQPTAIDLFCRHPARVVAGAAIVLQRKPAEHKRGARAGWFRWLAGKQAT